MQQQPIRKNKVYIRYINISDIFKMGVRADVQNPPLSRAVRACSTVGKETSTLP